MKDDFLNKFGGAMEWIFFSAYEELFETVFA